jgi:hypothetical protein
MALILRHLIQIAISPNHLNIAEPFLVVLTLTMIPHFFVEEATSLLHFLLLFTLLDLIDSILIEVSNGINRHQIVDLLLDHLRHFFANQLFVECLVFRLNSVKVVQGHCLGSMRLRRLDLLINGVEAFEVLIDVIKGLFYEDLRFRIKIFERSRGESDDNHKI